MPATLYATMAGLLALLFGFGLMETGNALQATLLSQEIFNAVLVLVVVTSVLGPVLTELFAPGMIKEEARAKPPAA